MDEIQRTLRELDAWYNDMHGDGNRPKLISKLAILELCGWLEHRMDEVVHEVGSRVGVDLDWARDNVIKDNHGFSYNEHLRRMLCKIVGQFAVDHIEWTFEASSPGTLDRLKSLLGTLWKKRGLLAHTHSGADAFKQETIDAPSWSIDQQKKLADLLDRFELSIVSAFERKISVQ